MPSFSDSIVLFILALLLFGPKKLPVLARELGKWMGEFRRASNEFKMQMEEELRAAEQSDRQKQIAAMEAAAPVAPALPEPEHPHLDTPAVEQVSAEATTSLPIATSGDLSIMPPATGLPTPRESSAEPLGSLLESIPATTAAEPEPSLEDRLKETALHGD